MNKTAIIMVAIMVAGFFSFLPNYAGADTTVAGKWFKMFGTIKTWNMTSGNAVPVFGWITTRAGIVDINGTTHEWATTHAIWSEEISRISPTAIPTENFTFSFYIANLVNVTEMDINLTGNSFYLSGYWNVLNITTTINVTTSGHVPSISFTRTIQPVVTNATGDLVVPGNSMSFMLDITGVGGLTGTCIRTISLAEIKMFCVVGDDSTVGLKDLVHVARSYGTTPGIFGYDINADVNGDGKIDIGDLTTIAANIQG